jgi:hypothetical protein
MGHGTATMTELAARTGFPPESLRAALDHLIRTGRVQTQALSGCSPDGCNGCSLTKSCALADSCRLVQLSLAQD